MRAALILLLTLCSGLAMAEPLRMLFVGNSLLYYNDVPHAVEALLEAEGTFPDVEVELLAEGGATLAEHVQRDALAEALTRIAPHRVVVQDRGPYPLCPAGDAACAQSRAAFADIVRRARGQGAVVVLMGTWIDLPAGQSALTRAFEALATQHRVAWADVGRARQLARVPPLRQYLDHTRLSDAPWWEVGVLAPLDHAPPDGHPAEAGGWLTAASLARALLGHELVLRRPVDRICRALWPGARLSAARLARDQMPKATVCAVPDPWTVATAVALANEVARDAAPPVP